MTRPLLLLRPQPGNDESADRACALGLDVVQIPLFEVTASADTPLPAGPFDALLLTSANGARFGGEALAHFAGLPTYAVGEATAAAARAAGFARVVIGGGDAASTAARIAADGHASALHLCGEQVRAFDPHGLSITRHIVYRAGEVAASTVRPRLEALGAAVAAIHSPRAGTRLADLLDPARKGQIHIAAISPAAATACGAGWASRTVSARQDDTSLLALAEPLCKNGI